MLTIIYSMLYLLMIALFLEFINISQVHKDLKYLEKCSTEEDEKKGKVGFSNHIQ